MNKKLLKILYIAVCILGISFVFDSYSDTKKVEAATFEWGTVSSSTLKLRRSPSSSAKTVTTLKKGTKVKCLNLKTTWIKVSVNNYVGYAEGKYLQTAYGTASSPYANVKNGTINTASLNIRASADHESQILKIVTQGTSVQVLTTGSEWVKVKVGGVMGYTQGRYISFSNGGTATDPNGSSKGSAKGEQIVAYARKFLGNRYVYGGTSLTHGIDCSGFTMRVYQHFGYKLPRTSASQRSAGMRVSSLKNARPGDLICYYGHVAIYMGNNKIIHASNRRDGIKISYNAAYRSIASIRRIIK